MPITGMGTAEPFGWFIPPCPMRSDIFATGSSEDSQNFNQSTVFNGKSTGMDQPRNIGMQTLLREPAPAGRNSNYTSIFIKKIYLYWRNSDHTPMRQHTGPRSPGSTGSQLHQRGSTDPQFSFQFR